MSYLILKLVQIGKNLGMSTVKLVQNGETFGNFWYNFSARSAFKIGLDFTVASLTGGSDRCYRAVQIENVVNYA